MKDLNILLLGEPGVGKTTFINSFINYFWYDTIEAAGNSSPIVAAPMTISFLNADDQVQLLPLHSNNERTPIKSNTKAREYSITIGEHRVRLIDSPGLDVSKDDDQDKFRDIFRNLADLEELHAVCFLLKSSLSRMNNLFEFYVRHALSELGETVIQNFVFVFTNGRSAHFDPSTARSVLRGFVGMIKTKPPFLEIPLSRSNVFCVENEAFVNLVALQCGAKFKSLGHMRRDLEESWEFSSNECKRLISCVLKLKPYDFPASEVAIGAQKFIAENYYDLFILYMSNYKNLEKCKGFRGDAGEACRMVQDFKEQLKSTGKQEMKAPNASKAQTDKGAIAKTSHCKNGKENKGAWSAWGLRTHDAKCSYFEQGYNKQLDKIQKGMSKMDIDDRDKKVGQLSQILEKHKRFFENTYAAINIQREEVHNVLKKIAQLALFLKTHKIDDEFEFQADGILLMLKENNDAESIMILDEMLQCYRRSKSEIRKNRKAEVEEEDVLEVAKTLERLQGYQQIIDNIFN